MILGIDNALLAYLILLLSCILYTLKALTTLSLRFPYVALAQRKLNEHATQIVQLISHLVFKIYLGKFGVLFTDYENILSKSDHHIYIKRDM